MTKPPDPRLHGPAAKWGRANGWLVEEVYGWNGKRVVRVCSPKNHCSPPRLPFSNLNKAFLEAMKGQRDE